MDYCGSLEKVLERIEKACARAGRKTSEVILLGASKTVSPSKIRKFFECGLKTFGENRVQEFLKKWDELSDLQIDWHFIGTLQSNKVKYIIDKVSLIHSLDRESLLEEISKRSRRASKLQRVLIEVNIGEEETKGGIDPKNIEEFTEKVLGADGVVLEGLMTIPPYFDEPERVRPYFERLRKLKERLESSFGINLKHLSMGMSGDFEVAVEEGATIVRIGTLLFGERS